MWFGNIYQQTRETDGPGFGIQATWATEEKFRKRVASPFPLGILNLLLSDGEYLYAHAHKRHWHHGDQPTAPGLWLLTRDAHRPDSAALAGLQVHASSPVRIHFLASVPLSDEAWQPLPEGALRVFCNGIPMAVD